MLILSSVCGIDLNNLNNSTAASAVEKRWIQEGSIYIGFLIEIPSITMYIEICSLCVRFSFKVSLFLFKERNKITMFGSSIIYKTNRDLLCRFFHDWPLNANLTSSLEKKNIKNLKKPSQTIQL